jgi:hypothetical protein
MKSLNKKQVIILVLLTGLMSSLSSQNIAFFSESLTFRLQPGMFELDGLYYLRNNTDAEVRQAMFYPYPDVEKYGEVSYISVNREGDTASLLVRQRKDGAIFMVTLGAREEASLHIRYTQNLISNKAKYIVLTTQAWGKPFETANYRLEVPGSLHVTSMSIEPDTIFSAGSNRIYRWERENFMPEVDFEFEFE